MHLGRSPRLRFKIVGIFNKYRFRLGLVMRGTNLKSQLLYFFWLKLATKNCTWSLFSLQHVSKLGNDDDRHHMQRKSLIKLVVAIVKRGARVMANALTRSTQTHAINGCFLFLMRLKIVSSNRIGFNNVRYRLLIACSSEALAISAIWSKVALLTFIQTSRHSVTFVTSNIG